MNKKSEKMSLKKRIIIASIIWVTIGAVIGYILLSSTFYTHVSRQFYDELNQHVIELENISRLNENGKLNLISEFSDNKYNQIKSGYYWEIRTKNTSLKSPSLGNKKISMADESLELDKKTHRHKLKTKDKTMLVVEKTTRQISKNQPARRIIIAVEKRHLDAMVGDFNTILLWAFSALSLAMMFAAYILTRFALRPFKQLSEKFNDIRYNKSDQIEGNYPKEVTQLVNELNAHIQTTKNMIKRARTQAGNLAHGLKGSLAIIADEGYKLQEKGQESSAREILAQCNKMQRHIDHHIARARAVAAAQLPSVLTNIEEVLPAIINAMKRLHKDKVLQITLDIQTKSPVHVDEIDFNEIIGNVLDNASKAAKKQINISVNKKDDFFAIIRIEDDGDGLPQKAYEKVFDIGERWDETTSGGGLGLAIVRELVQLYAGSCKLDKSPLGGLRVDIILPLANN